MLSFWNTLPKPFFVLAPMKDVTDIAFRRIVEELGKPDVFFTEFISADGLFHLREIDKISDADNPILHDLIYTEKQRPIVAQLFGSNPDTVRYTAKLIARLGFDGVDINMGCPDRSVEKQGAGAALIKNPERAVEIIAAAKDGVARSKKYIPVSVKTRIGYDSEIIDEWITTLLRADPAAITVHLRTRKEMSNVSAHWEYMERIVKLRDLSGNETIIVGNGDVQTLEDAKQKAMQLHADGIMVGRAVFGNPWFFSGATREDVSAKERLAALITLCQYFSEIEPAKHFNIFKKHIKAFVTGFRGATEIRAELMKAKTPQEFKTAAMKCNVPL